MNIGDVKRWQWILIGLLVGIGLGWAWSSPADSQEGRHSGQLEFEQDLWRVNSATNAPLIKDIVIQPEQRDYAGKRVQFVTYKHQMRGAKSGQDFYVPEFFEAKIPYKPFYNAARLNDPNATIADYLTAVTRQHNTVSFRVAWYNQPREAFALWTAGSLLLIGGVWPTVLHLLTGAGLGGSRAAAKKEDYFDRFSHAPEAAGAKIAPVATEEQRAELDEMNRSLEERLAAHASEEDATTAPLAPTEAPEIRKLQGGPLQASTVAAQSEDDVELKGEFYPVIIHHKKKDEDSASEKHD